MLCAILLLRELFDLTILTEYGVWIVKICFLLSLINYREDCLVIDDMLSDLRC